MTSLLTALLAVVIAAGAAIVIVEILHQVTRRLGRRSQLLRDLATAVAEQRSFPTVLGLIAFARVRRTLDEPLVLRS